MAQDPRRDPSWRPPAKKQMLGVRLLDSLRPGPPSTKMSDSGAAKKDGNHKLTISLSAGAAVALVLGLWQGLPPLIASLKSEPVVTPSDCATQESVDQLAARVQALEERKEYDFQFVCALNEGNPGPGAKCEPGFFFPNRTPPPKYRTDRLRK